MFFPLDSYSNYVHQEELLNVITLGHMVCRIIHHVVLCGGILKRTLTMTVYHWRTYMYNNSFLPKNGHAS